MIFDTFGKIPPETEMILRQTYKKYHNLDFIKIIEKKEFVPEDVVNIDFTSEIIFFTKDNTKTLFYTKHGTIGFILNSNLEVHKGRQIINTSIFRHEIKPFFKISIPSFYNIEIKKNPKLEYISNVDMFFDIMYPNDSNIENKGFADEYRVINNINFHIDFDNYYFSKNNITTVVDKDEYLFEFIFTPVYGFYNINKISNNYKIIKNTDVYDQLRDLI